MIGAQILSTLIAAALIGAPPATAPTASTGGSAPSGGTGSAPATTSAPAIGTAVTARDREISAIEAELARGLAQLRLTEAPSACDPDDDEECDERPKAEVRGEVPAPYFAVVRMVRAQFLSLDGSYGGVITDASERQAVASIEVRVGGPQRDNGGIFGAEGAQARFLIPLDPAADVTRKNLWLAMDQAYRAAAITYAAKQAILARLAGDPPPPDFGPPPETLPRLPEKSVADEPIDREGLRRLAAELSARFSAHPEIDNGDVFIQLLRTETTTITSEGALLRERSDRAVLSVVADTRAADGMHLDHGRAIHFQSAPRADDELRRRGEALVDQVLSELGALAAAPMIEDDYDGPVLFAGDASPQFLASTVATQAGGKPAPLSDGGRLRDLEPQWQDDLGKEVMPTTIDLVDDPREEGFGRYVYDADGFVAAPITLVRRGELVDLLMTREPNKFRGESNGRCRQSPVLMTGAAISNLRLESKQRGRSRAQLERELLRRAREDGYDFAYVIEQLRDGNVLGPVPREGASTFGGARKIALPLPALIYKVEPGGKRTLVRGALIAPASMRVLRRVRALGDARHTVPMRVQVGAGGGFAGETGMDGILSHTVDIQVAAPDLLLDGLELLREQGEHERLPELVHPLRDPAWSKGPG
ncbi:MAG: metallopeptidase TldD-related protein [Nannocystaceae bacterium]